MLKKFKLFSRKAYKKACIPDKVVQQSLAICQMLNCKN